MRSKAKVYQRAAEPPRMRITERDLGILQAVADFRFISGDQVEQLIFTKAEKEERKKTRCSARLRKMFDNGLLGRVRWPFHAITLPQVYFLEKEGADFLSLKLGLVREQIKTLTKTEKRPVISRSFLFLAHTLAINDFRIDVTLACERSEFELLEWLNEYQLGRDYAEITYQDKSRKQAVQPDGYFAINAGEQQSHFFLEMDMETTPSRRWASKVLALYEYRYRGKYTERFGTKSLRVLCVAPSDSRKDLLVDWTREVIPERWQPLFWFATQDEIKVESVLTAPIWEIVGQEDQGEVAIF